LKPESIMMAAKAKLINFLSKIRFNFFFLIIEITVFYKSVESHSFGGTEILLAKATALKFLH